MPYIEFNCLPTIIGSMPHTDPLAARAQVVHYLKDMPAWPQLPKRGFKENMYAQFSQGFPGLVITEDKVFVDRGQELDQPLAQLYADYLENDIDNYAISPEYAAGLHAFLAMIDLSPRLVKGQITGPVTWGTAVTDDSQRAIIYDDTLADAAAKLLRLRVGWQERELSRISPNTVIFIDEPAMASFGSAFFPVSREQVVTLLEEVLGGISGISGIHCCGNTDWPVLLATSVDIISFDTYNYAPSLTLYPVEVKAFLARNGTIAWGIVPDDEASLSRETVASLKDRLEEAMAPFTRNGIRFRQLIQQGILTPSCSLAGITVEAAARTLELLSELSAAIRKRYL